VLAAVTEFVGDGPYFSNGDFFEGVEANLNGHWATDKNLKTGDPRNLVKDVKRHLKPIGNHTYYYDSCTGDQHWTTDPNDPASLKSACDSKVLARFLLAVEEGVFLGTNGWDPDYEKPLGDPLGPAVFTTAETDTNGAVVSPATLHRNFTSGTYVLFTYNAKGNDGSGVIWWEGKPPTPAPPTPAPIACGSAHSSFLVDTTYAEDDIAVSTETSATDCCAACAKKGSACLEWSFHPKSTPNQGSNACHLHGKSAVQKEKKGVTSGVMVAR
jgi:hypothetical protein